MKKVTFEKVTDGVYYLPTPFGKGSAGITLIKGDSPESTVLIDTGEDGRAITEYLIPALKAENLSLRDIGCVTVTHCHADNIGGLATLRKECPDIKVVVPRGFADFIRNPMAAILRERERFPMHSPQFQEIHGVYVDRELTPDEDEGKKELAGLRAIRVGGHSDGVCWFHVESGALISGDALQGNGNEYQGMPFYTSVSGYKIALKKVGGLPVNFLISSHDMDGIKCIERGNEAYKMALKRCEDCVTEIGKWIKGKLDKGITDVEVITRQILTEHFEGVPEVLAYAMQTVEAHIKERIFS